MLKKVAAALLVIMITISPVTAFANTGVEYPGNIRPFCILPFDVIPY